MVERHPYTVDTGVQFSNEVPLRTGGRVAQCTGLQIRKTVGSNPTQCSKFRILTANNFSLATREVTGSSPVFALGQISTIGSAL